MQTSISHYKSVEEDFSTIKKARQEPAYAKWARQSKGLPPPNPQRARATSFLAANREGAPYRSLNSYQRHFEDSHEQESVSRKNQQSEYKEGLCKALELINALLVQLSEKK